MAIKKTQYLSICFIGDSKLDILKEFGILASNCQCNITDARMSNLGMKVAMLALLQGSWDAIAKFETNLASFSKKMNLEITAKRTELPNHEAPLIPYTVQVTTPDNTGVLRDLSDFFLTEKIMITNLFVDTYEARNTGMQMSNVMLSVNIPIDYQIADLRERFFNYCDLLNIDALLEPEKV